MNSILIFAESVRTPYDVFMRMNLLPEICIFFELLKEWDFFDKQLAYLDNEILRKSYI